MSLTIYLLASSLCAVFIFCDNNITETSENAKNTSKEYIYCNHPDCSVKNQHTLCLAANKQSPRLIASGITSWMRYQILMLHNRHRDNIALGLEPGQPPATNMRKMYWDNELEEMAEVWARQCQKRHDECRNTIRFNAIQNMDVRPVLPRVTETQLLSDAVGAWFSGSRVLAPEHVWSFKLSNCSAVGGCNSHWYSAAAWGSTWRLGCSQALCTAKKRSCAIYRKKRRIIKRPSKIRVGKSATIDNVTRTTTLSNPILRRTQPMTLTPTLTGGIDEVINKGANGSPIHRGILEIADKEKSAGDVKIVAFTFCNYGPAGNIEGFPMYEAGTACSNCPQGTRCGDKTHRALCAVVRDPDTEDA